MRYSPGIIYYQGIGVSSRFWMRVLYGIFVLCLGALLWAAFSAARHIRHHEAKKAPGARQRPEPQADPENESRKVLLSTNRSDQD